MKCHQRTIREQEHEPAPQIELTKTNASVRVVTKEEAQKVILRYEWLGTMPAATTLATGLFFGEHLAGVEVFAATKPGGHYTLNHQPAICLSRGACVSWAPPWAGSHLISKSIRLLDPEKYHFVIAYSDAGAGEIGTIYQACNWICIGTIRNAHWLDPDGKRHDPRTHRDRATKYTKEGKVFPTTGHLEVKADLEKQGWVYIKEGPTRYRYVEATGTGKKYRERRAYLESISVPYPKRAKCQ